MGGGIEKWDDDQVIAAMLVNYLMAKENFDSIEWLVAKADRNFRNLGLLADEDIYESDRSFKMGPEEHDRTFSRLKWEVKKCLGCTGIAEPKIKYWEEDGLFYPHNLALISNAVSAVSLALGGAVFQGIAAAAYQGHSPFIAAGALAGSAYPLYRAYKSGLEALKHKRHMDAIRNKPNYATPDRTIYLSYMRKEHIIPVFAHEYTHFIQHEKDFHNNISMLLEGHARGIQRIISDRYAIKEDNPKYLVGIINMDLAEYKSVYNYVCHKTGKEPRSELSEKVSLSDYLEEKAYHSLGFPSPHALGNTLFSLMELSQGEAFYSMILKDKVRVSRSD